MRTLLRNEDLKALLQGVGVVALAGLLMGAVAHPNLRGPDDSAGPQIQTNGGGLRGVETVSARGIEAYGGRIPEYVLGTDTTRPRTEAVWAQAADGPPDAAAEPEEATIYTSNDNPAQTPVTRTAWRDEPREPVAFPSARGGVRYESNLPPPPTEDDKAGADPG